MGKKEKQVMPSRTFGVNQLVVAQLHYFLSKIEQKLNGDCLAYVGPIAFGADDEIRDAVEAIDKKQKKLVMILETPGGFAETARRIYDTVRAHYNTVEFVVPSYAMSAGTLLVMSGDAIYMDYYSNLGPIDPQIEGPDGKLIPALGYCIRYEELLKLAKQGKISKAEMEILLDFDQGQLYSYEQARDLSKALLEEWLVKHKFKDWKETETRKRPVTDAMKKRRAREIAKTLNDVERWKSHGIGINMERIKSILNLKVDDLAKDPDLHAGVRNYHRILTDFMGKMRYSSATHTRDRFQPV